MKIKVLDVTFLLWRHHSTSIRLVFPAPYAKDNKSIAKWNRAFHLHLIFISLTMASPPHRSTTNYSSLPNPRKRPSLPITSQPPNPKRRKHPSISAASTPATSHPLRQTSFPPEENQHSGARSASVESDATGVTGGRSVVTPGTGPKKRRRGRRKKRDGSVRDGSAKDGSVKEGSLKSGVKEGEGSVAGEEEEEEDDGDEGLEDDGERVDKVAEKKNLT